VARRRQRLRRLDGGRPGRRVLAGAALLQQWPAHPPGARPAGAGDALPGPEQHRAQPAGAQCRLGRGRDSAGRSLQRAQRPAVRPGGHGLVARQLQRPDRLDGGRRSRGLLAGAGHRRQRGRQRLARGHRPQRRRDGLPARLPVLGGDAARGRHVQRCRHPGPAQLPGRQPARRPGTHLGHPLSQQSRRGG